MSEGPRETEPRSSPAVGQAILLALFAVFVVLGVVTVLIPEISDDSNEDEGATSAQPASDEPDTTAGDDASDDDASDDDPE